MKLVVLPFACLALLALSGCPQEPKQDAKPATTSAATGATTAAATAPTPAAPKPPTLPKPAASPAATGGW